MHAWTTGSLAVKTITVYYDDVQKWSHTYIPPVTDKTDSGAVCTFQIANNTGGVLKAKAFATDGVTYDTDTQANSVDNAYLISVTRGTGAVAWKWWTGSAWNTLSSYCTGAGHLNTSCSGWTGSTQGGADGYCKGPDAPDHEWCTHAPNYPNHPDPNRCYKGDTPAYTGSGRDYPTIVGRTDYGCDAEFGTAKIWLPDATADCGCARSEIRMHGDQIDGACPGTHTLYRTLGCVRMQNAHVQALYNIVNAAYGRVGYDDIHVLIPSP
ncbi:MAG: hypothetical protein ACE149_18490 [Armatimonadota bacterium]